MVRRSWLVTVVLAWAAVASGANPRPESPGPANLVEESRGFANRIILFASSVEAQYYREVPRTEILYAALSGLYEAARQPTPPMLREDLRRFDLVETVMGGLWTGFEPDQPEIPGRPLFRIHRLDHRRAEYIARRRQEIGHVESLVRNRAQAVAAQAAVRVLDPFSGTNPTARRQAFGLEENLEFGIGLEFANAPNDELAAPGLGTFPSALLVKSVVPGSPAQKAGLRPDDRITRLDGRPVAELNAVRFFNAFLATASGRTEVRTHKIEFYRPGRDQPLTGQIKASAFYPECTFGTHRNADGSWNYMIDERERIGYIRVGFIEELADKQFAAALKTLVQAEARGLVLDLRWCPGGYLDPAVGIAKTLLPASATVALEQHRGGRFAIRDVGIAGEPVLNLPVVVLINSETLGGGELIAAALQDNSRAMVAGERTAGKATIQQQLEPNPLEGVSFRISRGLLIRPSGKSFQKSPDAAREGTWGITPDAGRWLPLSRDANKQLKELWIWHALRPTGDRSALPTDDPETDAQYRAAVDMLRGAIRKRA
ncbi:MAG: PDZ domain-containing protein [Gemmataceae bacterium]|nr:PDZ domain-containing protein [Gemmataceae bacterium]